jgi:membrane-bound lytic murein transglycosylase A
MSNAQRDRQRKQAQQKCWLLIVLMCLAACADQPALRYNAVSFADLPGWEQDDLSGVGQALRRSCTKSAVVMRDACAGLPTTDQDLRHYFTTHFTPWQIVTHAGDTGLFTGYYAPELRVSHTRHDAYQTPVYGLPRDLAVADLGAFKSELHGQQVTGRVEGGRFVPYPARAAITQHGVDAPVLAWAQDVIDVFILQIQGSGRLVFEDDTSLDVGYAGQNGRPYVAIGKLLKAQGAFPEGKVTMPRIRAWLETHPDEQTAVLAGNPSYVFFRPVAGTATGAQGVELTPERSLAVDAQMIKLGTPVWLAAEHPDGGVLQRLMVAQDTGGAIKGALRGDVYWGYGAQAAQRAGLMQSTGRAYILWPQAAGEPPSSARNAIVP